MAKISNLFRAPKRRAAMEELHEALVLTNAGIGGCAHARPNGKRQVLLMDRETLQALALSPGIVRENITTQGLDVNTLQIGEQLRVGTVQLQVTAVCEPCEQLEKVRPGLRAEMQGKRGMLCRVIAGGTIRVGDSIEKLAPAPEKRPLRRTVNASHEHPLSSARTSASGAASEPPAADPYQEPLFR